MNADGERMEQDAERLEKCMSDYGPAVLGLARRMLRDRYAAEDVFQSTFIKAYCRALPFRDGGHARAWLLRVAANECLSLLRSPWRLRVTLGREEAPGRSESAGRQCLQEDLMRLPVRYRQTVWLYYWAGYDTNEIAAIEGVPPATARTRLARAREQLRGMIGRGEGIDEG